MARSKWILPAVLIAVDAATLEQEIEFKAVLERMESDVLALRDEIERVYQYRCDLSTLDDCGYNNYNDCSSTYPIEECIVQNDYALQCGDGKACTASWDKSQSEISIPASLALETGGNPSDPEIIESVCYTKLAEPYLVEKYEEDTKYWSKHDVTPSWTYFGAHNGMFRQIPASHREECGSYDPRRRPWFVAASSGPKDVVLILDVSGSMSDYGRLRLMKDAATTVIETLSVADRVAVVTFSSTASILNEESMLIRATKENKDLLVEAINGINAVIGATDFHAAFTEAFNLLELTFENEVTTGCNMAVLFMTDGKISRPDEVITLVNNKAEEFQTDLGRKMTVFSFSLGEEADEEFLKTIACSTSGIWVPIEESKGFETDIASAMSSYYKLYALGLGEGGNEDFVSWVEPYMFFNRKKMGTTVSTPVYDRSVDPHLFLGVAAIDAYMEALEQIIGENATSSPMLQRFVELSTARCPKIELTECELDALRFLGGGERTTCGLCNNTGYDGIIPETCPFHSDWPSQLWANTDMEGKSHLERACCKQGIEEVKNPLDLCTTEGAKEDPINPTSYTEAETLDEPPSTSLSTGAIVGIVVGVLVIVSIIFALVVRKNRSGSKPVNVLSNQQQQHPSTPAQNLESTTTSSLNQSEVQPSVEVGLDSSNDSVEDHQPSQVSQEEVEPGHEVECAPTEKDEQESRIIVAHAVPCAPPLNPNRNGEI
mmetsp:Transcript_26399/g.54448  ORF Transcript_26399/g.54448 Transcript_26399/m.54448 type:complete len:718 (-) Transcript_26399:87-2240(-)